MRSVIREIVWLLSDWWAAIVCRTRGHNWVNFGVRHCGRCGTIDPKEFANYRRPDQVNGHAATADDE